jgi:hypothetical protein
MNARKLVVALALSVMPIIATAGNIAAAPAQVNAEPAIARETDSAAIAMLRANFTGRCRQNAECRRVAASTQERAAPDALPAENPAPSTPQRRRAIGLTEPSYTP